MEYTQEQKEFLFEQDKTGIFSTPHYVFHFLPGSLVEKEIELVAQSQEQCFSKICTALQVDFAQTIHYYFTTSPLDIGRIFWEEGTPCNGVALCGRTESKIYAVYNETVKCIGSHEDTHLISFTINYPESDFLVEGLAMCMDGVWWGLSNEIWSSYYKSKHPELSIRSLLENDAFAERGSEITYPIAGGFTTYLINTYGMKKYLDLYRYDGCDYDHACLSIFNQPLSEIEAAFWLQICAVTFDATALDEMLLAEGC